MLFKNSYYKQKQETDVSMKAHFSRCLMHFYAVKHNKTRKYYFNCKFYYNFVRNDVNNEYWFVEREVAHSYFTDVVTELVTVTSKANIRKV